MADELPPRLQKLHELLLTMADHVYYQPPSDISMEYPCIRYTLDRTSTTHADNTPFVRRKRYQATVIDADPDSEIPDKVGQIPSAEHDRTYTANNLNHHVFTFYF